MARKAADLDSLIRLRKWIVDERQRELGALIQREDQLIMYGRELEKQLVREGQIAAANPDSVGFMFGPFAEDHKKRRERLAITLAAVRKEIEDARDRLAAAYRERKTMQEVQNNRAKRELAEANRLEQIELDEVAQNQHRMRG
jgi:flagellar export protein FliJ